MKYLFTLLLSIVFIGVFAQRKITPSESIRITGKIKKEIRITIDDLQKSPIVEISNFILSNQIGEVKDTIKLLKCVRLKPFLDKIELNFEKPKERNEYYLVFKATDGYKAVFSWNEIFNTEIGYSLYLITELNGKKIKDLDDRITLISLKDTFTGSRHIMALSSIEVRRAK